MADHDQDRRGTLDRKFAAAALSSLGLDADTRLLAVCAGTEDWELLCSMGFTNVVVSNLDEAFAPLVPDGDVVVAPRRPIAEFDERSFDLGVRVRGLTTARLPHRAAGEMYPGVPGGIVAIELRDTRADALAVRRGHGRCLRVGRGQPIRGFAPGSGQHQRSQPVYRWTEAEVVKTLRSYDPTGEPQVEFRYGLTPAPPPTATGRRRRLAGQRGQARSLGLCSLFKRQFQPTGRPSPPPHRAVPLAPPKLKGEVEFDPDYRG